MKLPIFETQWTESFPISAKVLSKGAALITKPQALFKSAALFLFWQEIVKNSREMGCVCPSSRKLSAAMAEHVTTDGLEDGLVVELGGGTGVITQALLDRGIPHEQIVVVERSEAMVNFLKEKFPKTRVLCGDAVHLSKLLGSDISKVKVIVSSLPFRALSFKTIRQISREVDQVLLKGGKFIQFTYALHSKVTLLPSRFQKVKSKIVWRNLPPARVDVFESC